MSRTSDSRDQVRDRVPDSARDHDSVYDGLLGTDPTHWAFGTGFEDPLAGVDTRVASGVDPRELGALCRDLGDDALVLAHRLSQWCSRAPDLETDIAVSNIALDLLGQARLLLTRAAAADPALVPEVPGSPAPAEDLLAYFREADMFGSSRLAALGNADFAQLVVRLLLWSAQRLAVLTDLTDHADGVVAAVAAKGVREVTYHRDWSARWVLVLAGGTPESRLRLEDALAAVWPSYGDLLERHPEAAAGVEDVVTHVLLSAGVERPHVVVGADVDDDLPALLADLQSVARAHPLGVW